MEKWNTRRARELGVNEDIVNIVNAAVSYGRAKMASHIEHQARVSAIVDSLPGDLYSAPLYSCPVPIPPVYICRKFLEDWMNPDLRLQFFTDFGICSPGGGVWIAEDEEDVYKKVADFNDYWLGQQEYQLNNKRPNRENMNLFDSFGIHGDAIQIWSDVFKRDEKQNSIDAEMLRRFCEHGAIVEMISHAARFIYEVDPPLRIDPSQNMDNHRLSLEELSGTTQGLTKKEIIENVYSIPAPSVPVSEKMQLILDVLQHGKMDPEHMLLFLEQALQLTRSTLESNGRNN